MNIFILDWQHKTCAEYHCDKHVVKMPLETTQMLSTVHWRYNNDGPYLPVHQKHPCTLWAGQTVENYIWLWKLGIALCKEFTHRYDKVHSCERILAILRLPPVQLTARQCLMSTNTTMLLKGIRLTILTIKKGLQHGKKEKPHSLCYRKRSTTLPDSDERGQSIRSSKYKIM